MQTDQTTPQPEASQVDTRDQNMWAMLCHLSALAGFIIPLGNVIGPLVIWMIKKDVYPLVDDQGKEALNFQISMTIYYVVCRHSDPYSDRDRATHRIGALQPVVTIIAMVKASDGVAYRYPLSIHFIK